VRFSSFNMVLFGGLATAFVWVSATEGCTDETTVPIDAGEPPSLAIDALLDATGERSVPLDKACVEVRPGDEPTFSLALDVRNVLLRPPGLCAQATSYGGGGAYGVGGAGGAGGAEEIIVLPCGHLLLTVNGQENNKTTSASVDVLLRKLANRYTDLHIEIIAIDDFGFPIYRSNNPKSPVLKTSIDVTTRESCEGFDQTTSSGTGGGGVGGAPGVGGGPGGGGSGMGGLSGVGGTGGV
jgi:hypothetical protein